MSKTKTGQRKYHLEHSIYTALTTEDQTLDPYVRLMSTMLSTWLHPGGAKFVSPIDSRVAALLGCSQETVRDLQAALNEGSTIWRYSGDRYIFIGDLETTTYPVAWDDKDWRGILGHRTAMKRAARFPILMGDPKAVLRLISLGASLDYRSANSTLTLTEAHAVMQKGAVDVTDLDAVRSLVPLVMSGILESGMGGVRFSEKACKEFKRYESNFFQRTELWADPETAYEEAWCARWRARGAECEQEANTADSEPTKYALYALVDPRNHETFYVGITRALLLSQRENAHRSLRGSWNNLELAERKKAIREAGEVFKFIVIDEFEAATPQEAEEREREVVRACAADGSPLVNKQHLTIDFISG